MPPIYNTVTIFKSKYLSTSNKVTHESRVHVAMNHSFECSTCLKVLHAFFFSSIHKYEIEQNVLVFMMMKNTLGMSLIKSKLKIDVAVIYINNIFRKVRGKLL